MPVNHAGEGYIYGIADPETMETVYIGETVKSISSRLFHHMSKATDPTWEWFNNPFPTWVRSVVLRHQLPFVFLIETVSSAGDAGSDKRKRIEAEKFWIDFYRNRGAKLFNAIRSDVNRKWWAEKTVEERHAHGKKAGARTKGTRRRSKRSFESRSEASKKGHETRKRRRDNEIKKLRDEGYYEPERIVDAYKKSKIRKDFYGTVTIFEV